MFQTVATQKLPNPEPLCTSLAADELVPQLHTVRKRRAHLMLSLASSVPLLFDVHPPLWLERLHLDVPRCVNVLKKYEQTTGEYLRSLKHPVYPNTMCRSTDSCAM